MSLPFNWIVVGLGVGYLVHSGTVSVRTLGALAAVGAGGFLYCLWRFQEHLLFQPRVFPQHVRPCDNPPGMREPSEVGLEFEDVRLAASDGTALHAWLIRPEDVAQRRERATLLFFQENAGNMGMRMENLKLLHDALDCNIFVLSYRGYGESDGVPSEDGLYLDAEAALQWVRARQDLDSTRLILFGRSLGGAVALDLAAKHERDADGGISCVVVENTFASISHMVDLLFPYLSFAKLWILRMKWESLLKIRDITKPILFLSGARDEIVPASQMQSLFEAAVSSPHKEMVVFPEGQHNDTWRQGGAEYVRRLQAFVRQHAGVGSARPVSARL